MRTAIILFGLLLLADCLIAQVSYAGGLELRPGWRVNVYIDDTGLIYHKESGDLLIYGLYVGMPDRSGGSIYLDGRMDWGARARILAHEVCHARQDMEKRNQSEVQCNRIG